MTDRSPANEEAAKKKNPEYIERGKKGAEKVKNNQWDPKKVDYLKRLNKGAKPKACLICGDSRTKALHKHHANREGTIEVILCANCHDIVRRGILEDLEKAHKSGCPKGCG